MQTTKGEPLHQQLLREFRRRIDTGVWEEGRPAPTEAELCREFGTSRGPVRQAVATLRGEGLLVGGQGRPPVVRRGGPPSQPFTTMLSFTQWALSVGRNPGQATIEVTRRRADAEVAGRLGITPGDVIVDLLRLRLLDEVPAMLERSSFVYEVGRHLFDIDPDAGSLYEALCARGADLHHARHTIDAVPADSADAHLLGAQPGAALLRVRRQIFSSHNVVLESADDRYLPTMSTFTVENTMDLRPAVRP